MGNNQYRGVAENTRNRANQKTEAQMVKANKLINEVALTQEQALKIASLNVWEIIDLLNSNQLTSLQIILSLIMRTSNIAKRLHLYTETNFDWAIDEAIKCDEVRRATKKQNWTFKSGPFEGDKYLPPLYGIPISIKDTFSMKDFATTVGLLGRVNLMQEQSPLITCLKNSGMIPFVRSNIPQFGMLAESANTIWGRSLNPWNQDRTVGGSSGGEGGLISSRCSLIGVGSDIAGSLRIPSEFCGVYCIKPYSKRYPSSYHTKFSQAFTGSALVVPLCIGSIAKSPEDIAYWMKVSLNPIYYGELSNPYIKSIQFNDKQYQSYKFLDRKLRIGVITCLKDVEPTTASIRAVNQVKNLLTQLGHECFEVQIPNEVNIMCELLKENLGSEGKMFYDSLYGEQPISEYKSLFRLIGLPWPIRGLTQLFAKCFMPRINKYVLQSSKPMSAYQYQNHIGAILQYRQDWIKYWKTQKLDFVILPGFGCQALLHGNSQNTALAAAYTFIWNILDVSVGLMPVTRVKQNQQEYVTAYNDLLAQQLRRNAQNSVGLPVGVQVVGLPYEEEKILGFMSYLEPKISFYKNNPLPNMI